MFQTLTSQLILRKLAKNLFGILVISNLEFI